ncbi:expressed unknown protein [Seminavis robusta]|uniref:Uncharacterized protein n=1 Tax=Seminavis robusta TaxID=568900 RepID=A0A9N8HA24_9STRA|nr:expressed unknown protein [Seminavis robusta]|eukprot:Sro134_g063330.1 n/a (174) ;mRNA; r:14882-15403
MDKSKLNPVWVVSSAVVIMASVAMRRCCVRPGGLFHRWVKDGIRQRQNLSSTSSTSTTTDTKKTLLQYAGMCVITMALGVYIVLYLWMLPADSPHWYAPVLPAGILLANAMDHWIPKSDNNNREEVLRFRSQLRQSLLKDTIQKQQANNNNNDRSDSSESYYHDEQQDMEKCG